MNIERIAKFKIELSEEEATNLSNALGRWGSLISDHCPEREYTELVNTRQVDRVVAFRTLLINGLGR